MHGRDLVEIDHDGLDLLGAHHRPYPAPRGQPRRPALLVAEGDAREEPFVLAHGPAERDGDLLAIPRVQQVVRLEVALAEIRGGVLEGDAAVLLEVENHPFPGGAEESEAGDLELAQHIAERPSAVGLLDAARERALAAHAGAIGVGETRAGEGSRREDEGVLRGKRLDGGGAHLDEGLGDQVPARLDHVLAVKLPLRDGAAAEIDVVVDAHEWLLT